MRGKKREGGSARRMIARAGSMHEHVSASEAAGLNTVGGGVTLLLLLLLHWCLLRNCELHAWLRVCRRLLLLNLQHQCACIKLFARERTQLFGVRLQIDALLLQ